MAFTVVKLARGAASWAVVDERGGEHPDAAAFLATLRRDDRSAHTLRAYAFGIAHFLTWLEARSIALEDVTRAVIGSYVVDFRASPKGGAAGMAAVGEQGVDGAERTPRTVNHRLTVLSRFFGYLVERDREAGTGVWCLRRNPVPERKRVGPRQAGMIGRDAPRREQRAEMRMREPRRLPRAIEPRVAASLIAAARSWRDKALVTLLWRTGQRIGDWGDSEADGHGVLGMRLRDFDRAAGMVVVRLKGARDEHRVPVTPDFWPLFDRYLLGERGAGPGCEAAWLGSRRGRGRPLRYSAFESALRALGASVGVSVHAHMFRHAVAQAVVESSGVEVAQALLGHQQISTTIDIYTGVDMSRLVQAVAHAKDLFALDARGSERAERGQAGAIGPDGRYVFAYDAVTIAELERIASDGA
jgi:site-specific recombinase XerD